MELLDRKQYSKVAEHLQQVTINNLFARSVIERKVAGKVFVDDAESPSTFHVVHPYGMSLLFGNAYNSEFNQNFREYAMNSAEARSDHEWMQAFPDAWDKTLARLFGDCMITSSENKEGKESGIIELNTRINFKYNSGKFKANYQKALNADVKLVRTDAQLFGEMKGSVVPYYFWDSAEHFVDNGFGYSLLYKGKLASTAYSAFIHDDMLELGIETVPEFRGKGFAYLTCMSLIDYCLKNLYEPVWACRWENQGSFKLAEKLGFEVSGRIPYYRLSK